MNESSEKILDLKNKKILFFSPAFFGYEQKIAYKMRELGAEVDMYDVRSVTSAKDRALLKISSKFFYNKTQKYYQNIIAENKGKDYDYILIVKCDMTPINILQQFRKEYPHAKLCLYLWDSVENIPGITDKFKCFDTLHSFDEEDCHKYSEISFRPLFYADEYKRENRSDQQYQYDICFLGTIHSDRYAIIKKIREIAKNNNLKTYWFCYLQSRFIYYFYWLTKKEFHSTKINDFDFEKKSSREIADVVETSKIVLDIQHPKQTGLTMRTIEMVGMNKKLITTNKTIENYDFYNPQNIRVIDRKNVEVDLDFLNTAYQPLDKELYQKYSLENWIYEVLN